MNRIKSTNANAIGTLYLILAVFAGMIGTAFSVLIRLEQSTPGVQILQGDPLFIVQLLYWIASWSFVCFVLFSFVLYITVKYVLFTIHPRLNNILTKLFKTVIKFNMGTINFFKQLTLTPLFRYLDYCILLYFIYCSIMALVGDCFCASVDESFSVLPFGSEDNKFAFALCLLNNNNLSFNNNYLRSFLHSTAILKSNPLNPQPVTLEATGPSNPRSPILEAVERLERERLSSLQFMKYQAKPAEEEAEWYLNSFYESFPWFVDAEGKNINYIQSIRMFDWVQIVSRYLETRSGLNPGLISEAKLTEILELFKENESITVSDLYDHITKISTEDKNSFFTKLTSETENLSENLLTEEYNTSKPFGQYGDVTLNQIGVSLKENLKDINWELVYDQTRLTIHGVPVAVNAIGYGLVLKSYMKYIHNRPMDAGISSSEIDARKLIRNRQLGLFCLIGAPLTMYLLRCSTTPMKEMFTLTIESQVAKAIGGESQVEKSNSINSLLFLSSLKNKIPRWVKILFRILFVTILVLKLLGFSFLSVFSINIFYIKVAYYIIFSLIICYYLLSIYLLHKFSNKNIKILEVLPEFLIKWLKEIENMSTTKADIKEFKTNSYLQITVYLLLMIITIIATILF